MSNQNTENLPPVYLADYNYTLPEDRIAKSPLPQRDHSKLLVYQSGDIQHQHFYDLPQHLPADTMLVFNDTKVIPARLYFQKPTGALIEVFLLKPEAPHEIAAAMHTGNGCTWHCMIGNKRKWNKGLVLEQTLPNGLVLKAELSDPEKQWVRFEWDNTQVSFAEVLAMTGELPLPPYLNRKANQKDADQYQTVYSKFEGAVAAPTAGLHFTPEVINQLQDKGVQTEFLTLHVSAGTFQPVKVENVIEHEMHSEQLVIHKQNIEHLLKHSGNIVAVGTTSMRVLESVYWLGVRLIKEEGYELLPGTPFQIDKLLPYQWDNDTLPTRQEALQAILDYMNRQELGKLWGATEIFIFPRYEFKMCKGLITNYHLPKTTLILLVAAFVGNDWEKIYNAALSENYRFLSYGDSSLLWCNQANE